jgi:hypothetical protein
MKYESLVNEIKSLQETLQNIIDNNLSDEDAKSDLDMLINASSSSDYSLATLIDYLENNDAIEEAFSGVI